MSRQYHDAEGFELPYCDVMDPDTDEDDREIIHQGIQKTIRLTNLEGKVDMCLLKGKKVKNLFSRPGLLKMYNLNPCKQGRRQKTYNI
jgi:hypothetical protein